MGAIIRFAEETHSRKLPWLSQCEMCSRIRGQPELSTLSYLDKEKHLAFPLPEHSATARDAQGDD